MTLFWLAIAGIALAECPGPLGRWPSFRDALPTAKTIVVGEVTERVVPWNDLALVFRLRVDEVMRGTSSDVVTIDRLLSAGLDYCGQRSPLAVHVGDVIALASDGELPTVEKGYAAGSGKAQPKVAVAFIRGQPRGALMPGIETMTLDKLRALVMPDTDTVGTADDGAGSGDLRFPILPVLAAVLTAGAAVFVLDRRRRTEAAAASRENGRGSRDD